MTDRIDLKGIEVRARHGVLEQEKIDSQLFRVDLSVFLDLSAAGSSDDLEDTIDYGLLAVMAHDLVAGDSHQLLETVADRLATMVLDQPGVKRVVVTVHKPEAPIPFRFEDVAVTVDRSR